MIGLVTVLLVILIPTAALEGLRRADQKARDARQWRFIKAKYYGA